MIDKCIACKRQGLYTHHIKSNSIIKVCGKHNVEINTTGMMAFLINHFANDDVKEEFNLLEKNNQLNKILK